MNNLMQRYEKKYLLTIDQASKLKDFLIAKIPLDQHHIGDSPYHIHTYYFDNDSHDMVRMSLDSPAYKEKIRLRWYKNGLSTSVIFIENKKKFLKQSYKYRKTLNEVEAEKILDGNYDIFTDSVADRRMKDILTQYKLKPLIELHYDRLAFEDLAQGVRITLDTHLTYQYTNQKESTLLFEDYVILEVKCHRAFPIWMSMYLSEQRLHHQSLSKYGTSYTHHIKGALDVIYY